MDSNAPFPADKEILGQILGPARGFGNEMAQWVLKSNGKVIPRQTVRPLKDEEKRNFIVLKHQTNSEEVGK